MARNASILEELATYGFDLAGMDGLSADEMKAKYDAIMQRVLMLTSRIGMGLSL